MVSCWFYIILSNSHSALYHLTNKDIKGEKNGGRIVECWSSYQNFFSPRLFLILLYANLTNKNVHTLFMLVHAGVYIYIYTTSGIWRMDSCGFYIRKCFLLQRFALLYSSLTNKDVHMKYEPCTCKFRGIYMHPLVSGGRMVGCWFSSRRMVSEALGWRRRRKGGGGALVYYQRGW